jgi:hypothetical protein
VAAARAVVQIVRFLIRNSCNGGRRKAVAGTRPVGRQYPQPEPGTTRFNDV